MRKYKYREQSIQDIKAFSNDDEKLVQYALDSNHKLLRELIGLRISQYKLQISIKKDRKEREIDETVRERLWKEIDELQDKIFLGYNIIEETYDAESKEFAYRIEARTKKDKVYSLYDEKKDNRQRPRGRRIPRSYRRYQAQRRHLLPLRHYYRAESELAMVRFDETPCKTCYRRG